ncbi:MAG: hypothetical protein PHF79_00935 [Candidatus Pacebacteria bacterium]|nr:hypothetical protein [Candidatus Paceibacterota bacterium]
MASQFPSSGSPDQEKDRIEALKKKLYSPNQPLQQEKHRHILHPNKAVAPDRWQQKVAGVDGADGSDGSTESASSSVSDLLSEDVAQSYAPLFKKVFLFALVFFLVAASIAAVVFFRGSNVVSPNNINIALRGPVSIPAGEPLAVDVTVTNGNPSELLLADVVVTYPPGARQAKDLSSPLVSERIPVGTLASGQAYTLSIDPVLYGQENSQQDIKVSFEYRIPGSTAIFVKDKDYPIFIGSSPIVVNVSGVKEVIANQDVTFDVDVKSNSTQLIKNLILKAEYPFGFQFENATPDPSPDNATWKIGDMPAGGETHILLKGKLSGQDGEQRVFRFSVGIADQTDPTTINGLISDLSQTVAIKQPFLGVDITLDEDPSSVHVVQGGASIRGQITWQNNLSVPLNDVTLQLKVGGDILNRDNVSADRGFFRSIDNTLIWDKTTVAELASVPPQSGGLLQFTLATADVSVKNNAFYRKPTITLDASVQGSRLSDTNVPEEINSTISKTIKVVSAPRVAARLVRTVGPFINTGPLPPQAEHESTYTVIWTASNSFNTVNGTVVTATLPNYVTWLGKVAPSGVDVTYNAEKHQIVWNIGDLPAGTGYASAGKEVDFQVSILPSVSQADTIPVVLQPVQLTGTDSFTGTTVQYTGQALDTQISTDPSYVFGQEKVTK